MYILSFLDSKDMVKMKKIACRKLIKTSIHVICYLLVLYQLVNCIQIYSSQPTAASMKIMNTSNVPVSFTFCIIFHQGFDGNFDLYKLDMVKEFQISNTDGKTNLLAEKGTAFDFVVYTDKVYMCKEIVLPLIKRERAYLKKLETKNLQLFIHQPGMFMMKDFGLESMILV